MNPNNCHKVTHCQNFVSTKCYQENSVLIDTGILVLLPVGKLVYGSLVAQMWNCVLTVQFTISVWFLQLGLLTKITKWCWGVVNTMCTVLYKLWCRDRSPECGLSSERKTHQSLVSAASVTTVSHTSPFVTVRSKNPKNAWKRQIWIFQR